MGQPAFLVLNLLALVAALLLADLVVTRRNFWLHLLSVLAGFGVIVLVTVLLLGAVGRLQWPAALLVLAALVLALAGLAKLRPTGSFGQVRTADSEPRPTLGLSDYAAVGILAGLLGALALATCLAGAPFGRDTLSYHAPPIAQWIVNGSISLAPFNYHAYYPLNGEILSLWWMLPSRSDAMASLSGIYAALLLATAAVVILARLGVGSSAGFMTAALILVAKPVMAGATTFAAVDLIGPAMILAALGFAISSRPSGGRELALPEVIYSALCAGFAAGAKVSFSPVAGILLLWLGLRLRNSTGAPRVFGLVAFSAAASTTGAYWYVRNALISGNALFPAALGPFSGPFTSDLQARTTLIWWVQKSPLDWGQWASILNKCLWWPDALALPMAIGYLSGGWDFWRNRGRDRDALGLLLAVGLLLAALHPFTPFSGTPNSPEHALAPTLRYLVTPFAIGILLFGRLLASGRRSTAGWWTLAIVAVVASFEGSRSFAAAFILVATAAIGLRASVEARPGWIGIPQLGLFSAATLTVLALWMPFKQTLNNSNLWAFEGPAHPIGAAWKALEKLPTGARVAWFGPFQYYPLYGRRFQLVPVPVEADGRPYQPLHVRWHTDRGSVQWWPRLERPNLDSLVENLRGAGVEYVLVSRYNNYNWDYPPTDIWPHQYAVLGQSEQVQTIFDDGYTVIWSVMPGSTFPSAVLKRTLPSGGGNRRHRGCRRRPRCRCPQGAASGERLRHRDDVRARRRGLPTSSNAARTS